MMDPVENNIRLRGLYVLVLLIPIALMPIGGEYLSVKRMELRELLIPVFFLLTLVDFAVAGANVRNFMLDRNNKLGVLLFLFMFVLLANYARNPLLPTSLAGEDAAGGFKTYYRFLNGLFIYLMVIYWVNRKGASSSHVIKAVAGVVLIMVCLGYLVRFTGINIPGLADHAWTVSTSEGMSDIAGASRVPFLEPGLPGQKY